MEVAAKHHECNNAAELYTSNGENGKLCYSYFITVKNSI